MGGRRELGGRGSRGAEVSWKGRGEGAGKLRNSEVKLRWVVVVVGGSGGGGWYERIFVTDRLRRPLSTLSISNFV